MRSTHRLRQVSAGNLQRAPSLMLGHGAPSVGAVEIAQQTAMATAQSMISALVGGASTGGGLPGLQIFARPGQGQASNHSAAQGSLERLVERAEREQPVIRPALAIMDHTIAAAATDSQESFEGAPAAPSATKVPAVTASVLAPASTQGAPVQISVESGLQAVQECATASNCQTEQSSGAAGVQASLAALARAHYEQEAPAVLDSSSVPKVEKEVPLKKPASKKMPSSKKKAGLKRPAAFAASGASATPAKTSPKLPPVLKRPASKGAAASRATITQKEAKKLRPEGCSKCRWSRVGCCRSCWAGRGVTLLDD